MGYKHEPMSEEEARAEIGGPTYGLKVLPGYDRRPRVLELARSQITDLTVTGRGRGPARLQLFEHALAPLADLPVREIVSASHLVVDLTLGRASCVHDYLPTPTGPTRSSTVVAPLDGCDGSSRWPAGWPAPGPRR